MASKWLRVCDRLKPQGTYSSSFGYSAANIGEEACVGYDDTVAARREKLAQHTRLVAETSRFLRWTGTLLLHPSNSDL